MVRLLSILKQYKPFDTPDDTLEVLVYEVGEVSKCVHHARNFPKLRLGYVGELQCALADTLAQILVLAEWYEIPREHLMQLAHDRFIESMKEKFPKEGESASV